jgi:deoxyadenosine/deoxycytidine kinase
MLVRYNYLVIEGNIGAGKTTLATKIAEQFGAGLVIERFADNPYLARFYKDPERYSFPLELSFLADRYKQLRNELMNRDIFSSFTVADYYFTKSLIFASATLTGDEFNLYRKIFHIIYSTLPRPDLYVYLHLDPERLLINIRKRGREYEKSIDEGYLRKIQDSYFNFFRQDPDNRYLVIDINRIDFVEVQEHYLNIIEAIFSHEYKPGLNKLIL